MAELPRRSSGQHWPPFGGDGQDVPPPLEREWLPELDRLGAEMDRVEARIDELVPRLLPGGMEALDA